ncbi:MAG: hypothetical protein R3E96_06280 [Planctomycetota bacterium]
MHSLLGMRWSTVARVTGRGAETCRKAHRRGLVRLRRVGAP